MTGIFMAGISLSQFNVMIKLAPEKIRAVYLALYAAITGLIGGTAPIIGGLVVKKMDKFDLEIFGHDLTALHMIFIVSAIIQIVALFVIFKVREPAASTPMAVLLQLKNDLNPQTGIASTTDFIVVNVDKTKNIFKSVDQFTDKIVERSEKKIGGLLDKFIKIVEKPFKKIRDFFKD